ncbi:MAG: His/Gly/Thr/Pro-type tRNA ligase C-terminal domain-containing protein, partial [Patescibacteria group bacterium]
NLEKAEFERERLNPDEKQKEFKIDKQPEWVCTMEDNTKHYGQPLWRYLKNVVYKDENGRLIVASVRGDQEVNEAKLKRAVNASFLEPATDADLKKMGTKSGWVHSWGHKGVTYVGDLGLEMVNNFIGGQKEKATDSFNVNYGRDFKYEILADIVNAKQGDSCAKCKKSLPANRRGLPANRRGKLKEIRGIEIAHAFKLGTCYSQSMGAKYLDEKGKEQLIQMGCYGLGISRLMAVVAEFNRDENGLVWPETVAPYKYHLVGLDLHQKEVAGWAEEVYQHLLDQGQEVLFDDRLEVTPGEKFKDADLIGIPWRLVVSARNLKDKKIEVKKRDQKDSQRLTAKELVKI